MTHIQRDRNPILILLELDGKAPDHSCNSSEERAFSKMDAWADIPADAVAEVVALAAVLGVGVD